MHAYHVKLNGTFKLAPNLLIIEDYKQVGVFFSRKKYIYKE